MYNTDNLQTKTNNCCFLEPRASFVKKLPDITLAVQGSDIKLTVELSKPDVPVKWLRYPDRQIFI